MEVEEMSEKEYEKNPAYLSGVWDAIVSWAEAFEKRENLEAKVKAAQRKSLKECTTFRKLQNAIISASE
ncbi:MAG: hypothetical protein QXD09_05475 [Candidatus Caldarchaeum sp.]